MAFLGYMIKLGGSAGTELPMEYVKAESYNVEPARKTETENRKAVTGLTHRGVAEHTSVRIQFETKSINNTSLATLNGLISAAMTNTLKRDITIEYYDTETDSYKEADCYMPDIKYVIRTISQHEVIYNPITYTFIEY